jgi:hypothetical protein
MKKIITCILTIAFPLLISAQQKTKPVGPLAPDQSASEPTEGIAVTPSSLRFNAKPGTTATKQVKVTNDTKKPFKFQVGFSDFQMDRNGKPVGIKASESKYTLSKWISVSPSYFDLNPGESKSITVTIDVPDKDTANIAAWTIMTIDQATDRAPLDANKGGKSISLGILPSFGFGVYLYQNPPNVKLTSVEIKKFVYDDVKAKVDSKGKAVKAKKQLVMEVLNTGDGIGFCSSYVELTNKTTGTMERLPVKQYTILPGFHRDFFYPLPEKIASGNYSAVGVLDFGSKESIEASELDFTIPK